MLETEKNRDIETLFDHSWENFPSRSLGFSAYSAGSTKQEGGKPFSVLRRENLRLSVAVIIHHVELPGKQAHGRDGADSVFQAAAGT